MQLTYYNHYDRDTDTHDTRIGIITDDTKFIDMYVNDDVNPEFLAVVDSQKSLTVDVDAGTATFRKENKKYWYAYKKLKGKLNKAYVGSTQSLTELSICKAVEDVNIAKEPTSSAVTQKDYVTALQEVHKIGDRIDTSVPDEIPLDWNPDAEQWKRIAGTYQKSCDRAWEEVKVLKAEIEKIKAIANPTTSLAGNGKNENHLQANVIDCFESLAIAQNEIIVLNKMLKDGDNFLRAANEKNDGQRVEIAQLKRNLKKLEEQLEKRNALIDTLEQRNKDLNQTVSSNAPLVAALEKRVETLQGNLDERDSRLHRVMTELDATYEINANLQMSIDSLEVGLKKHQRDYQDLNERHLGVKELHGEALTYIHKLESDIETLTQQLSDSNNWNRNWLQAEIDVLKDTLKKTQDDLKVALVDVERYELATRNEEKRNSNLRERIFELERKLSSNSRLQYKDDEIKALKKEIQNKTYKINDLQREIQEYHREKLEQSGISLPPRQETFLTLSGNFTKTQLDKAAKQPVNEKEAFDNLNTFEAVMPIIHRYRVMADGKTKKANPRYAYLIDFLADIDKLS
jgi:chromosome segregation ATPase